MPLLRVSFGHDPCQFSTIGCFSGGWNLDIFKVYDKAKLVSNNSVTLTTYHWVFSTRDRTKNFSAPPCIILVLFWLKQVSSLLQNLTYRDLRTLFLHFIFAWKFFLYWYPPVWYSTHYFSLKFTCLCISLEFEGQRWSRSWSSRWWYYNFEIWNQ